MNNQVKSYISIILVCVFWGLSCVSTKICLEWFTPFSLAFYRFLIASVVMYIVILYKKIDLKITFNEILKLIFMGFIGIFLYFALENYALKLISASLACILVAMLPAFTIVSDYFVLGKPFTKKNVLSVVISVIGACLVAGFNCEENSSNLILGIILIVLTLISWLVYSYFSAPMLNLHSPLKITFYQTLFGTIFFAFTLPFSHSSLESLQLYGIIHLLFLAIFCSALCYILYNFSLKYIDIMICSIFINLMPIVTVIASIIILDEKLNLIQLIGSTLIIISVFVATKKNKKTKRLC